MKLRRAPTPRPLAAMLLSALLLAVAPALHAHQPFEVTGVGRFQHERLEFTVTLSLVMANYLLRDELTPEEGPVTAENFAEHRNRLLARARSFYELREGDTLVAPESVSLTLNASHEPEFLFIYPAPSGAAPLVLRLAALRSPGQEGEHLVRFYDDNESLLAATLFGPPHGATTLPIPLPPISDL